MEKKVDSKWKALYDCIIGYVNTRIMYNSLADSQCIIRVADIQCVILKCRKFKKFTFELEHIESVMPSHISGYRYVYKMKRYKLLFFYRFPTIRL